jgi:hypothetical protein
LLVDFQSLIAFIDYNKYRPISGAGLQCFHMCIEIERYPCCARAWLFLQLDISQKHVAKLAQFGLADEGRVFRETHKLNRVQWKRGQRKQTSVNLEAISNESASYFEVYSRLLASTRRFYTRLRADTPSPSLLTHRKRVARHSTLNGTQFVWIRWWYLAGLPPPAILRGSSIHRWQAVATPPNIVEQQCDRANLGVRACLQNVVQVMALHGALQPRVARLRKASMRRRQSPASLQNEFDGAFSIPMWGEIHKGLFALAPFSCLRPFFMGLE